MLHHWFPIISKILLWLLVTCYISTLLFLLVQEVYNWIETERSKSREVSVAAFVDRYMTGQTVFALIATLVRAYALGRTIYMVLVLSGTVFLGFVFAIGRIPALLVWIAHITPARYEPAVMTLVVGIFGSLLFTCKMRHQMWYGVVEMAFAVLSAWAVAPVLQVALVPLPSWASFAAAAYLSVRSLENVFKGLSTSRTASWIASVLAVAGIDLSRFTKIFMPPPQPTETPSIQALDAI